MALPPPAEKKPPGIVTHGPWGGNGGTAFDDGTYTGIRQIIISRNVGIVYMKVLYEQKGEAVWGRRNGGTGGFKKDKVNASLFRLIESSSWILDFWIIMDQMKMAHSFFLLTIYIVFYLADYLRLSL